MKDKKTSVFRSNQCVMKGELPPALLWLGDVETFLDFLPQEERFDLIITSPPYNIGKPYEEPTELEEYLVWQRRVVGKCIDRLNESGSICWQVGNYLEKGSSGKESAIVPLDFFFYDIFRQHGLKLRNRIIWHFGHGLHCKHRFSGRYEVVLWFTKSDEYFFDLDAVRVKPKYPGKKHFKGPQAGQYSCNPKGKNPEDLWEVTGDMLTAWDCPVWQVPNVKSNHVEKTPHPCQFPVALVDRFVLSMCPAGGIVFDPFAGVASAGVAALLNGRKFRGCEIDPSYVEIGRQRMDDALAGKARVRPFDKPIYDHRQSRLSEAPDASN